MARIETDAEATERHMKNALAKNEERWEALRQAALAYAKALNAFEMSEYDDINYEVELSHAEKVLKARAERYHRPRRGD